jgi:hypothetical protein
MLLTQLPDDFLQACFDCLDHYISPLFGTPDHTAVATVAPVSMAFGGFSPKLQSTAECYLLSRTLVRDERSLHLPSPKQARAFHPHGSSTGAFRRGPG